MKIVKNWRIKRLDELVFFRSGGTPLKANASYWQGTIPWISASSMHHQEISTSRLFISKEGLKVGSKLAKKNSLLLLVRGSMLWKKIPICLCNRDVAFNQDVKSLEVNEFIISKYLLYWFLRNQYFLLTKVVGTGIGAGKLDFGELKALDILLPPLAEQKAIAELLSTWDNAIETTEKLITAKENKFKWLRNNLISDKNMAKNGNFVPLGKFIEERNEKSVVHDQYPVLTSSRKGLFYQSDYFSKQVASKVNIGYKVIYNNDFTYRSMSDDKKFTFNRLNFCSQGIISPAYGIFYPVGINSDFFLYYLNSPVFSRKILRETQGGTRISLKLKVLKKMKILLPPLEEQQQIAGVLTTAKKEIDLLKELADKYKIQKRGVMQKLLTGNWRIKPEIINQYQQED